MLPAPGERLILLNSGHLLDEMVRRERVIFRRDSIWSGEHCGDQRNQLECWISDALALDLDFPGSRSELQTFQGRCAVNALDGPWRARNRAAARWGMLGASSTTAKEHQQ